jgi:hypothetical protein
MDGVCARERRVRLQDRLGSCTEQPDVRESHPGRVRGEFPPVNVSSAGIPSVMHLSGSPPA